MLPAFRHQPPVFAFLMKPDLAAIDRVRVFGAVVSVTLLALGPLAPRRGVFIRYTATFLIFQ